MTQVLRTAAVLSLLLCLATAILWVRSYSTGDILNLETWKSSPSSPIPCRYFIITGRGGLMLGTQTGSFGEPPGARPSGTHLVWRREPNPTNPATLLRADSTWSRFGFEWNSMRWTHQGTTDSVNHVTIPLWLLVIVLGALPAVWLIARFRRRSKPGLCPKCNYDLRATPDGCPECGWKKPSPDEP